MITNKTDVTIKTYYLDFIRNAHLNYIKTIKKLNRIKVSKINTHNALQNIIDDIKELYKIDLTTYTEFTEKEYNENECLFNDSISIFKKDDNNREIILQLIKYCRLLKSENEQTLLLKKYEREMNMKNREYEYLVSKFFYKMHEQLLNGDVIKLPKGLGQMYIIRKLITNQTKRIDYKATNERKKYLLENGIKIYNKEEEAKCKAAGIEYDGVDYRVLMNRGYADCIYIDNSKYWNSRKYIDIKYIDYINPNLKNMTYNQIADEYKKINEIYDLRMSLKRKLSILLINYPQQGLNYIRI